MAVRSSLKLGVLVNEVASIDVDSQLLNAQHSNAAAGIRTAQLAGGCACCAVSGELHAALAELAGSSSYQQLDYLVRKQWHKPCLGLKLPVLLSDSDCSSSQQPHRVVGVGWSCLRRAQKNLVDK